MVGGGFLVDYLAEKASGVLKEVKDPTDPREVWDVISNQQLMDEKESEALRHATGVSGTELLAALVTRGVVGRGGIANALKGLGIETIGEGAGEAAGQQLAYGEVDPAEVALEAIGGFAQSAGTTTLFYEAKDPNLQQAQKTATDWAKIDPNRKADQVQPDFTKIKNELASNRNVEEAFYSPEIGKAAYHINKARQSFDAGNMAPEEADVTANYVRKLTEDYILNPKADPAQQQDAIDLLQQTGFGDKVTEAQELFQQRLQEEEAKKQVQEQAKLDKQKKKAEAKTKKEQDQVEKAKLQEQKQRLTELQKKKKEEKLTKEEKIEEVKLKRETRKAPKKTVEEAPAPIEEPVVEPVKSEEEIAKEVVQTVLKKGEPVRTTTAAEREAGLKQAREAEQVAPVEEGTNIPIRTPEDIGRAAERVQGTTKEVAGETVAQPTIRPVVDWRTEVEKQTDVENDLVVENLLKGAGIQPAVIKQRANTTTITMGDLSEADIAKLDQAYGNAAQAEERLASLDQQVQAQYEKDNPLPANAFGGTHGKGYKTRPTGRTIEALNKKYGSADKYTFREYQGKWYAIPREGVVALDERKATGSKNITKAQDVVVEKEFEALKLDRKGNSKGPLWSPVTRIDPVTGARTEITNTIKLDKDGIWWVKLGDGTWARPETIGVHTQEWFNSNKAVLNSSPIAKEGETVFNVKSKETHQTAAKKEEAQRRVIEQEKKAATTKEAPAAPAPTTGATTVPWAKEQLDFLVDRVKTMRANAKAGVKDNIKEAELNPIFGDNSFSQYNQIAMLYLNGNIQSTEAAPITEPVVEQPPVQETPPEAPQTPVEPVVEPAPPAPTTPVAETLVETPVAPEESPYPELTPEEQAVADEVSKTFTSWKDALQKSGLGNLKEQLAASVTQPQENIPVAPKGQEAAAAQQETDYAAIANDKEAFMRNSNYEKGWIEKATKTTPEEVVPDTYTFRDRNGDYQSIEVNSEEDTLDNRISAIKHFEREQYLALKKKERQKSAIQTIKSEAKEKAPTRPGRQQLDIDENFDEVGNIIDESGLDFSDTVTTDIASDFDSGWNAITSKEKWKPSNQTVAPNKAAVKTAATNLINKIMSRNKDIDVIYLESPEQLNNYPILKNNLYNRDGTPTASYTGADGYYIRPKSLNNPTDKHIVIIIGEKMLSEYQVTNTIMHEVVGHYGFTKFFGKRWVDFADKIIDTNPKAVLAAGRLIERWQKMYVDEKGNYQGKKAFADKPTSGYVKVTDGTNISYVNRNFMRTMMDEYIAEEAAKYANNQYQEKQVKNFIQRIIAYVRHLLRSYMGGKGAETVTDSDIAGLIAESYIRNVGARNERPITDWEADKNLPKLVELSRKDNKIRDLLYPTQKELKQRDYTSMAERFTNAFRGRRDRQLITANVQRTKDQEAAKWAGLDKISTASDIKTGQPFVIKMWHGTRDASWLEAGQSYDFEFISNEKEQAAFLTDSKKLANYYARSDFKLNPALKGKSKYDLLNELNVDITEENATNVLKKYKELGFINDKDITLAKESILDSKIGWLTIESKEVLLELLSTRKDVPEEYSSILKDGTESPYFVADQLREFFGIKDEDFKSAKKRLVSKNKKEFSSYEILESYHIYTKLRDLKNNIIETENMVETAPAVAQFYGKMNNPLVLNMRGAEFRPATATNAIYQAKQEGRDGIVLYNLKDRGSSGEGDYVNATQYIMFDPNNQLKSVAANFVEDTGIFADVATDPAFAGDPEISYAASQQDPPNPNSVDILHDQWKAPQSQLAWVNQWREGVDHMFKKVSRMKGMGWVLPHRIAGESYFKDLMYKAQGSIRRIETTTRPVAKWLSQLASKDPVTMGRITNTWLEGGDFNTITGLSKPQIAALEKVRGELETAQQGLNALGYLDDFKYEASKGKYLHTVFLSMANEYSGAGKTPSLMKYLMKRKTDPEAKAFLGINRNPEFAIPNTVGMIGRDVALLQLMDGVVNLSDSRNLGWVFDGNQRKIDVRDVPGLNKKKVTYPNLLRYLDQTNELLKSSSIKRRGATAEDVATLEAARAKLEQKVMEARPVFYAAVKDQMLKSGHPYAELDAAGNVVRVLREPQDNEVDFFLKNTYIRVDARKNPNLKPFHNKYVHKDIYNEFVNVQDMVEGEVGGAPVKQLWNDMTQAGGLLEKLTAIWKQTKTGLNIPVYYMRNAFGNWWLMDTTTDTPSHKLMGMLIDEAKQTIAGEGKKVGGKTFKEWAEEYGLYATTFGSAELYILRQNFLDKIRIAEAKDEKNWVKYGALQFKDSFLTLSEMTANFNGLLEGIFKQTSMRDYVERWENRTGRKFNNLTAEEQAAIMSGAARHANDSIFDYQNVPAWLKQLRRIPLGTPFLTFNYYIAAHLPKAMLKHPWKMAKYYALPMMMLSAALELGFDDEEKDDYQKALESLPWYYRNNASHLVTPFKDANGKYQIYDFTYMFPPAMFTNAFLKMANPTMGETTSEKIHDILTKDLGLLGGPVPQAIAAILTNKNPFNDREITVPGDLPEKNIERMLTFFYTLAMPPVITETGFLGRMLDQGGIDLPMISTGQQLNKFGSDKETVAQTAIRLSGMSPVGFDPREAERGNIAKYQYHLQNIQKARANALKDRNKSPEDRQKIAQEYAQKIRELNAEFRALRGM